MPQEKTWVHVLVVPPTINFLAPIGIKPQNNATLIFRDIALSVFSNIHFCTCVYPTSVLDGWNLFLPRKKNESMFAREMK